MRRLGRPVPPADSIVETRSPSPQRLLTTALLLLAGLPAAAWAQAVETFRDEEQVTAADVVVEVAPAGVRPRLSDRGLLTSLKAADFEVALDGTPRPVVGLEALGARRAEGGEAWTIALYFDRNLANPHAVRWAAGALADRAQELTAQGAVEIWTADPVPVQHLAPTRDAELLASVLSGLYLFPEEGSGDLERLRYEFLEALAEPAEMEAGEVTTDALARAIRDEEVRRLRAGHDALLLTLVDGGAPGARRALFWVSGGFDLDPGEFYRPFTGEPAASPPPLLAATEELAQTLAAYGWTVFAVRPPDPEPRGATRRRRLGRWLLHPHLVLGRLPGLSIDFNEHRDPERAEAYVSLGGALADGGELERAVAAYRKALYHFDGDPGTAERQAIALVLLGELLEKLGKRMEARLAFERAIELDPRHARDHPGIGAAILEPLAPLELLTEAAAGALVEAEAALDVAVASLGRRVRLTYQLSGPPDGALAPLEVRLRRAGARLHFPRWGRSGVPETVAAARVRRLLAGELPDGELPVRAEVRRPPDRSRGTLRLHLAPLDGVPEAGWPGAVRITLGRGDPETEATVRHLRLDEAALAGGTLAAEGWEGDLELPGGGAWVAVLVEDLETGRWGADVVELRPRP